LAAVRALFHCSIGGSRRGFYGTISYWFFAFDSTSPGFWVWLARRAAELLRLCSADFVLTCAGFLDIWRAIASRSCPDIRFLPEKPSVYEQIRRKTPAPVFDNDRAIYNALIVLIPANVGLWWALRTSRFARH